ncbi:MAG TPA: TolC family protein, partial [Burkholderiales bacterium]|nr:TolC family protein [Burkholderiales bacterium]
AAEANLAVGRERLNALLGLWGANTGWKIDPRLPEILDQPSDFTDLERQAISASFDLTAVRRETVIAARQLGLGYAALFLQPLELGLEFEREEGEWERGPSIEMPIPLFDFGRPRRAAAQATLRQLQQAYTAQAIEVRAAVRAAAQMLAAARARSLHVKNVLVPLRTRTLEQTQLQYHAMQVGIFQLLQAKREQIAAGLQWIESLRDYWVARTELEQILNGRTRNARLDIRFAQMPGMEAGSRMVSGRLGLETPGAPGKAETGGH